MVASPSEGGIKPFKMPIAVAAKSSRVEWSRVESSGVEWSGVEWSGVEWSGVESNSRCRSQSLPPRRSTTRGTVRRGRTRWGIAENA